ncbi:MAG: type II toxin-antitoxin system VapC family toxin [Methylobacteriaceae bacterium]|nr:type II toxin-antitoxin system VapC family toxin [Methylobacteriaceae bacterium]MBV9244701.1 type II toxin-antitoxin system VapC family toxin [Methylobacteriaceae bacterium]MBV9637552.1 type II toxin-antitoxin system VapC family toxin [Methylobacteriaceae bacterium]MBV9702262.1 type II toxin-antitoxin system VapC family toxin [Methylobacteriaceae bacterium]
MIGIDTNILLRYLLADDAGQSPKAKRLIDGTCTPESPALINAIVLAETYWYLALRRRVPKSEIIDAFDVLLSHPNLRIDERDAALNALAAFEEGSAGFVDYFIACINTERNSIKTLTYDRKAARHSAFALFEQES